jgi:hypothetical protein
MIFDYAKKMKSLLLKIRFMLKQRRYVSKGGEVLRYLYYPCKTSDFLCVVFSGFAGHDVKGRYNYVKTLKKINCNKLFILDDHGYNSVGSYYLGNSMRLYNESAIEELISSISKGEKKLIFAGSSKGGSASLIYGLKMNAGNIIIGSPQYRIGNYLQENEYHKKIAAAILYDTNYTSEYLNELIDQVYNERLPQSKIWLMYSSKEISYDRDVSHLIDNYRHLIVNMEDKLFISHDDTGKFFIPYLKTTINKIINEEQ